MVPRVPAVVIAVVAVVAVIAVGTAAHDDPEKKEEAAGRSLLRGGRLRTREGGREGRRRLRARCVVRQWRVGSCAGGPALYTEHQGRVIVIGIGACSGSRHGCHAPSSRGPTIIQRT